MKKSILCFLLLLNASAVLLAQKRFKDEVFPLIDSITNIQYGEAVNIKGQNEQLLLDVFQPSGTDTLKYRPLVIFIHGGGFQNNSKTGGYSSIICQGFARRGYVTATIDYRLGVEKSGTEGGKPAKTNTDYWEALYRAQQDGKAAVRFFRRYHEKYGIDTSRIYITGSSAGSMTCLAMAYMDEEEVPTVINRNKWGTLEGNSGNEGYSSSVRAVMNAWGAMIDYRWIGSGNVPLFNTSGLVDKTVPYDSSDNYKGFKYGGYVLYQRCLELGIPTGWRPFVNTGHTLDNDKVKQDSCMRSMADWLYTLLRYDRGGKDEGVFRWEKDIRTFDEQNQVSRYVPGVHLFIGSSYLRMWKSMAEDLQNPRVVNRGFGGCNLRDVAFYIDRIIGPFDPAAVFLYVGNDIVGGPRDKEPDQVFELYKYTVKRIRFRFPEVPIVWLGIFPSEKRWAVWDRICSVNRMVRDYAASEPNLYFIDAGRKFLGRDGKPDARYYLEDRLHFNAKGYQLWGKNLRRQIRKTLPDRSTANL